jgi:molecular chaperone GrpE
VVGSEPMPDLSDPSEDEAAAPGTPPVPNDEPPKEDWEKRFTYLYSDFENFRRRVEREREGLKRRSQADVLRGVLPLLEASEKAVEAVRGLPAGSAVRKGVEMLRSAFDTFLEEQGVRPVAQPGASFRPEEHEAVGETEATDEVAAGSISTVVQQGYAFPGGLLRPAKVLVAREHRHEPSRDPAPEPSDGDPDRLSSES